MLLVSLSLWNDTILLIHCSPVEGESGWMYILLGISGSALPATIQRELWNLYRQSSTATTSMRSMYLVCLSRPLTFTLNGGNIRLNGIVCFIIIDRQLHNVSNNVKPMNVIRLQTINTLSPCLSCFTQLTMLVNQ